MRVLFINFALKFFLVMEVMMKHCWGHFYRNTLYIKPKNDHSCVYLDHVKEKQAK